MSANGPFEAKFAATHSHFQFRSDYRVQPGAQPQPGYVDMLKNYFPVPILLHKVWVYPNATTFVVPFNTVDVLVMDAGHINVKVVLASKLYVLSSLSDPAQPVPPFWVEPVEWYAPPGYGMMVGPGDIATILMPNYETDTNLSYGVYYSYK